MTSFKESGVLSDSIVGDVPNIDVAEVDLEKPVVIEDEEDEFDDLDFKKLSDG